tara:strand:- start:2885 stop:3133 length:249 start_codon:yes stop_codon:yes gene_type:complete
MTNPYEIITESNMNAPTARLLNKQVNCKRKLVIYNGENMVGYRFTFVELTKQQAKKLIDGGVMPSYVEDGKSLTFDFGTYKD